MAKGQQKGNREMRKPKSEKQKPPVAQTSPFLAAAGMAKPKGGAPKKGR
jgi:hypothetical protein